MSKFQFLRQSEMSVVVTGTEAAKARGRSRSDSAGKISVRSARQATADFKDLSSDVIGFRNTEEQDAAGGFIGGAGPS